LDGFKPLERRYEAREGFVGKRRSGAGRGKPFSGHPTERSSEGAKAQERGELREASEGLPRAGNRREGSQTLGAARAEEAPSLSYLGENSRATGRADLEMLEGRETSEEPGIRGRRSAGTGRHGEPESGETARVARKDKRGGVK
jgi:hypothetical protein